MLDVLGEATIASRFEAMRSAETPLVGRQEEIELLLRRWAQSKAGEGRIIFLSGEAGVGKSRLTAALRDSLDAEQPYIELHYFCSPNHENGALFPIINLLERAAAFDREDTPATKLNKLEALMAQTSASEADVALLADLLLLPIDRYATIEQNPRRRKEETFEALQRQLTAFARKPVLMTFEDLHWIDPTTLELLDPFIRKIEYLPVLLIATFRPDFVAPWADQSHVTLMTLNRLSRNDSKALVRHLAANTASLRDDLIGEIVERSDGVPLFLEEVTKTILGAGPVSPSGSATPHPSLSVPPTLHASLIARLDRIGPAAKEIAQIGATIGREFSYELTALVAERSESDLKSTLSQLVDAGLILQRGEPPQSSFLFKHGCCRTPLTARCCVARAGTCTHA
jgi:predicted ATPase